MSGSNYFRFRQSGAGKELTVAIPCVLAEPPGARWFGQPAIASPFYDPTGGVAEDVAVYAAKAN